MFAALQSEITTRCHSAQIFFSAASPLPHPAVLTAKGMMFVELYAVYEYTVIGMVRASIAEMKTRPTPINTIKMDLLALALHPEMDSIATCGYELLWKNRLTLLRRINATDNLNIDDGVFPKDGSHFKVDQIHTIWALFGITADVVPDRRMLGYIGELVEHRNAIAHGRMTAVSIGARYSIDDIQKRIIGTQQICLYLVSTMQSHIGNPINLQR